MNHGIEITEKDEYWMKDDLKWIILEQYLDISGCSIVFYLQVFGMHGFSMAFLSPLVYRLVKHDQISLRYNLEKMDGNGWWLSLVKPILQDIHIDWFLGNMVTHNVFFEHVTFNNQKHRRYLRDL